MSHNKTAATLLPLAMALIMTACTGDDTIIQPHFTATEVSKQEFGEAFKNYFHYNRNMTPAVLATYSSHYDLPQFHIAYNKNGLIAGDYWAREEPYDPIDIELWKMHGGKAEKLPYSFKDSTKCLISAQTETLRQHETLFWGDDSTVYFQTYRMEDPREHYLNVPDTTAVIYMKLRYTASDNGTKK